MRLRVLLATALAAGSLAAFAPQALAGGYVCYSVQASVNGEDVVNDAQCVELP